MDKELKKILTKLDSKGYNSYLVGGYVRDYLLGLNTCDIDITTNTPFNMLKTIFDTSSKYEEYNTIKFNINKYNISITTFRKDENYYNNKPQLIKPTNSILEDAIRRDFTINAIYMDKNKNIIDPLNGRKDISNCLIKVIGDVKTRIFDDNTRLLRAIRFMTTLDFSLDYDLKNFIIENKDIIKNINFEIKKKELDKIFSSNNYLKFFKFIEQNDLKDSFDFSYQSIIACSNYLGIWAQIECSKKYNFSKKEKNSLKSIKKILESKNISNKEIFHYGLDNSLISSEILNIENKNVIKMYKKMPIKNLKDLNISFEEIKKILNNKSNEELNIIMNNLINYVLEGRLKNKYNKIKEFLMSEDINGQDKRNN